MPTPDEMYDEAIALNDQGNLEGCVAKLREVLAIEPNHVLTHSALGVHLQKVGMQHQQEGNMDAAVEQYNQAIEHAKKVVELEPEDSFSYTQLSVIYQRCGKIPEAEHAMAQAQEVQARG